MTETESEPARGKRLLSGGFWRRVAAAAFDGVVATVLLTTIAVIAYGPTGGFVRMDQSVYSETRCEPVREVRGVDLPPGFRIDVAQLCVKQLFGREIDRALMLEHREGTEEAFTTNHLRIPLSPDNRQAAPHYLDTDLGIVWFLLMVISEAFLLTTPGKFLLGLRLVRPDGERPSFAACAIRNLVLYGGYVLGSVPGFAFRGSVSIKAAQDGQFAWTWGGTPFAWGALIALIWMITPVIALILQRPDPFYDRLAGVKVVRR